MTAITDVVFVGNNYGQYRLILAESLKAMPFDVKIYGRGYPDGISEGESLYNFRKTGAIYRDARIAIADNQFPEATGFASDRLFMALAAGNCLLMHRRVDKMEELLGLKDGVHYIAWDHIADLEQKIRYYLEHEDARRAIADAGTKECRENHSFAARVKQLRGLIANLPKKRRTLSVAMIVCPKDHGKLLKLAPELLWADEIVIVETGAHAQDFEWLENFQTLDKDRIKVFHLPWTNDFSAPRNYAKYQCTGDYIFWMDADERLPEKTQKELARFDQWSFRSMGIQMPQAFKFRVVNFRGEERESLTAMQLRLFQNIQKVEWGGRIHEHDHLDGSARNVGLSFLGLTGLEIHHHLPVEKADILAKEERNLTLLLAEIPSPWRDTYIAIAYAGMENWGSAIVWFSKASTGVTDRDTLGYLSFNIGWCYYKMGFSDQAYEHLKRSNFLDAKFLLAELTPSSEPFPAAMLKEFLDGDIPDQFPSYAVEWKKEARMKLLRWHREEFNSMAEAAGLLA